MTKNKGRRNVLPGGLYIKLEYIIPSIIITVGIIFSVKTFAEQGGELPESNSSSTIDTLYDNLVTLGYGTDTGSIGTYWNRIKSSSEWTPSGDVRVSDVVSGKTFYSDSRTELTGTLVIQNYINQHNMEYDDWNCSGNNSESSTSCVAGDSEYTGEEASWYLTASGGTAASVTDNGVTVSLFSNKVYQDSITKLYWTDASATTLDNEFIYTDGDDRVNPIGTSCNLSSSGIANEYCDNQDPTSEYTEDNDVSAAEFCLNLQLDSDNADGDNNGLTGVETDWVLPTQKELIQAYIDGVANNLPNVGYSFWSSTEESSSAKYAWNMYIHNGDTGYDIKTTLYYVRCVRND